MVAAAPAGTLAVAAEHGRHDARRSATMAKILIGYDGTESAKRALERASTIARDGDEIGVISVAPIVPVAPRSGGPFVPGDTPVEHRAELAEALGMLRERGIEAVSIEAVGDPGTAICEAAEEHGYDTIIVGSRNLGGIKRLFLGSVSERVAHRAKCDVLIAR
jgi:nucleotide-binding universal stress UspA family protein